MRLDWTNFTPGLSLLGGAMIGISAVALLLFAGRIAGISGILGGLLRASGQDRAWRVAFLAGLVAAPAVCGGAAERLAGRVDASWPTLVLAGVLVGYGTRLGNGCTSGHGVCGLSNLSPRSLVAVLTFMAFAMLTVLLVRHGVAA